MKPAIPTSFKLGAHTWRVKLVKQLVQDGVDCFGNCDSDKQVISIALHISGKPTNESQRFSSFLHEFMHAAMHTLGMEDNEQIAAGMEQMLLQLFKTARWKKPH